MTRIAFILISFAVALLTINGASLNFPYGVNDSGPTVFWPQSAFVSLNVFLMLQGVGLFVASLLAAVLEAQRLWFNAAQFRRRPSWSGTRLYLGRATIIFLAQSGSQLALLTLTGAPLGDGLQLAMLPLVFALPAAGLFDRWLQPAIS
jgi:hypothetical protein